MASRLFGFDVCSRASVGGGGVGCYPQRLGQRLRVRPRERRVQDRSRRSGLRVPTAARLGIMCLDLGLARHLRVQRFRLRAKLFGSRRLRHSPTVSMTLRMLLEKSSETNTPGMDPGEWGGRGNGAVAGVAAGVKTVAGVAAGVSGTRTAVGAIPRASAPASPAAGHESAHPLREVPLPAVATSACAALVRSRSSSACLRKSSMFFMLAWRSGANAVPGAGEEVRRRDGGRDEGLLPGAGDDARLPSPLRRKFFCAVPRFRLPGAEFSRLVSPGRGGRICVLGGAGGMMMSLFSRRAVGYRRGAERSGRTWKRGIEPLTLDGGVKKPSSPISEAAGARQRPSSSASRDWRSAVSEGPRNNGSLGCFLAGHGRSAPANERILRLGTPPPPTPTGRLGRRRRGSGLARRSEGGGRMVDGDQSSGAGADRTPPLGARGRSSSFPNLAQNAFVAALGVGDAGAAPAPAGGSDVGDVAPARARAAWYLPPLGLRHLSEVRARNLVPPRGAEHSRGAGFRFTLATGGGAGEPEAVVYTSEVATDTLNPDWEPLDDVDLERRARRVASVASSSSDESADVLGLGEDVNDHRDDPPSPPGADADGLARGEPRARRRPPSRVHHARRPRRPRARADGGDTAGDESTVRLRPIRRIRTPARRAPRPLTPLISQSVVSHSSSYPPNTPLVRLLPRTRWGSGGLGGPMGDGHVGDATQLARSGWTLVARASRRHELAD